MPISLTRRSGTSKEKKANTNSTTVVSASESVPNTSLNSSHNASTQEKADDDAMKSITGRSSHPKLDPDSSSLGPIDSAKEAKEKNRSWVKTIGIRTLRLRKEHKNKSSAQGIFSSSTGVGVAGQSTEESVIESVVEPRGGDNTGSDQQKHVKKSSSGASKTSNGTALREIPSSSSTTTIPGADSLNKADETSSPDKQDPARFAGDGMSFKAKLIGILEVSGPRGDRICQEALSELKMAVKAAGEHKQKITLHVALDGLRIRDEKTGDCLYHHQVHKISFIAQDLTDARAFGYIFGSPDMGHRFFGIKTEKSASQVVIAMRDLFQVVFDLKKKEIERAKQQLEMQQKFLATRAAETAPKVEHKTSIAETYIEGACALGNSSEVSACSVRTNVPEMDLLNLEVELNSLQEGLDNIHNNFAEHAPFRGSTASISSDPMNPKFSTSSQGAGSVSGGSGIPVSSGVNAFGGDPFGDSFDPFDASGAGGSASNNPGATTTGFGPNVSSNSANHQQSPLSFGGVDPFAQIDPFPEPKFNNLENSDPYFNADPFDTPMGNFAFTFPNEGVASVGLESGLSASGAGVGDRGFLRNNSGHSQGSHPSSGGLAQRSSSAMAESITSEANLQWKASFDDNFVPDGKGILPNFNGPCKPSVDIFTELDPLGTGRVRPFVDRKDFFQDLKNPPRKQLKDLYSAEFYGDPDSTGQLLSTPPPSSSPKAPTKVQSSWKISIPNSFSTNFNPVGFDSAFKSTLHASSMSKARKSGSSAQQQQQNTILSTGLRDSFRFRSESPPNYSPPPPPPSQNPAAATNSNHIEATNNTAFSNNEYFATPPSAVSTSTLGNKSSTLKTTTPLLPPPGSSSASPGIARTNKKSPQLLKQMTISAGSVITSSSSSPKTLPRSTRLGKQTTIDLPSADEMSPIPNLTPPPRPPHHGTLSKNVTLATAVPRPYSSDKTHGSQSHLRGTASSALTFTARTFTTSSQLAPEPPPRPLQTNINASITNNATTCGSNPSSPQIPLVSPPPLPPKKTSIGPTLSNPSSLSSANKNLYTTADVRNKSGDQKLSENDLPLPLPSRKIQNLNSSHSISNHSNSSNTFGNSTPGRYASPGASRYEAPEIQATNTSNINRTRDINNKIKSLSMEQALQQVASLSLMQLAAKLELPVEKLSNFTIQQLAEKLTLVEVIGVRKPEHHRPTSNFGSTSQVLGFESNFDDEFSFTNDISTVSAPGVFHINTNNSSNKNNTGNDNYDKYAVFRELTVEDASGFSVGADNELSDEDRSSRTQDKTLTRDSSSERTLQVEEGLFPASEAGAVGLNTMDDVTDGNLSDENDKFPLDEEVSSKCDWATFDTNFDEFTIVPPGASGNVPNIIKLESVIKPDSPWDSDENESVSQLGEVTKAAPGKDSITNIANAVFAEDKLLHCVLPPDPEEFNFQPFEKPAPIITGPAPGLRRSSKDRNPTFEAFEMEPRHFKRQSSGSSKHSLGKNSDYSDSGRHRTGTEYRSRNNSRDLDSWDVRRDHLDEWEQPLPVREPSGRVGREKNYDSRRDHLHRSDSRGSYSRQSSDRTKYAGRDSDEDFVTNCRFSGNSRDGSLRRKPSRESSARSGISKRDSQRSKENLDNEEEDEVDDDDDDRSYASYHSSYSQSSHRRRRHHPKNHSHHHYPGRRRRHDYSPEKYSNHESDFDDSYEEEPSRKSEYSRERFPGKASYAKGRPTSGGSASSSNKRYEHARYDQDSAPAPASNTREYYKPRAGDREREGRAGRYRRSYRRPPEEEELRVDELQRDYSDYSCEENSARRRRYRRSNNKSYERERPYYYTNSPSWDSESQSPERGDGNSNSGGDRRKIRWGGYHRDRPRQSPSPLTISRQTVGGEQRYQGGHVKGRRSDYRFEDDFGSEKNNCSTVVTNNVALQDPTSVMDNFGAFTSNDRPLKGSERKAVCGSVVGPVIGSATIGTCIGNVVGNSTGLIEDCKPLPPQSPFEDNFVIQLAQNQDDRFDSIEFKRGEDVDHFGLTGSNATDVFFPAKFDVDLEVEKEIKRGPVIGSCSSISITPISTVSSSAEATHRSSPSALGGSGKRLESIRSEEERLESSEDGADVGVIAEEDEDEAEPVVGVVEVTEDKDNELVLEKTGWMSFDTD